MNNLIKYKLDTLYEMSSGISSTPDQAGHGSPFLSFSTVFNNFFLPEELSDKMKINDRESKSLSINEGDVFLTRTSETIDELGISSVALKDYPKSSFSGFLKRLRPLDKKKVYPKYMSYYFRAPYFRKVMLNNATLTLRASLNENIFSYLDIYLPKYFEQKKIGDFLYSITKKIDLNNRINEKIIKVSKEIFDYWFMQYDFPDKKNKPYKSSGGKMVYNEKLETKVPYGWEFKNLGSLIKIHSGYPFKSETYNEDGRYNILTIKNIHNHNMDISKFNKIENIPNNMKDYCKLSIGDMLVSLTGEVGRICYVAANNFLLNQRVGLIKPKKNFEDFEPYIYFLLHSEFINKSFLNNAGGSNQDNLSPIKSLTIKFINPPVEIMKKFSETVKPLIKTLIIRQSENFKLLELQRNLISGFTSGRIKIDS
jgi:type I restriction enzyme, S subunit